MKSGVSERRYKIAGLHALIAQLRLPNPLPRVRSEIIPGSRRTTVTDRGVLEQYPQSKGYRAEGVIDHLRFALRYEPISLDVYKGVFESLSRARFIRWIEDETNGIYARRAWYLYELLTGKILPVKRKPAGAYVDLLDPVMHIVGPKRRITRQRLNDNLLGNRDYCPLIRRTDKLERWFESGLAQRARDLVSSVDPGVLKRAVTYLFTKETKSTFAIEGEMPGKNKTERFVAALRRAASFDAGDKAAYIALQRDIVDSRYAQNDWRKIQVYVGQTLHDYSQQIHFVCPKPEDVGSLVGGWMAMVRRLLEPPGAVDEVCAAAAAAFGFVFIHPFEDGNGRIHRFLVHHVLTKTGFTPPDVLFPASAAMLRDRAAYDRALECFSNAIRPFVKFTLDRDQQMKVTNRTVDLYRYFDATPQAEYLYECMEDAISRDLKTELDFLKFFDASVRKVSEIVDMPNRRVSLLVGFIQQNKGRLSKAKRRQFAELTDEEVKRIERAVLPLHLPLED